MRLFLRSLMLMRASFHPDKRRFASSFGLLSFSLPRFVTFLSLFAIVISLSVVPGQAQVTDVIEMQVDAAFGGYFRENDWLPLRINVRNSGDDMDGKLIVRPETSGRVVSNAYSTPISLPNGASQTVFLYIQARTYPPQVTVELLNEDGARAAQQVASIQAIGPQDGLHIYVGGPNADTVLFGQLSAGGFNDWQVRWDISNIPDHAPALEAVDTIMLNAVDSESLTSAQREALTQWVIGNGHLIVTGGPEALSTAAAINDLLPLVPHQTETIDGLPGLAPFVAGDADDLSGRVVVATGDLREDALVLAATEDETPLLVRWQYGGGTVDYLAADPTLDPLGDWDILPALWFNLATSRDAYPAWSKGVLDYDEAAVSVAIMPGIDLLPPASSMLLYLGLYILLIGPVNYIILSRLNRRGWAWVTIPLLIAIFAGLSWTVGFNLRGNDVIISRLHVVESWPNVETARVRELLGVLSPRRQTYALSVDDDRFLRVVTVNADNLLAQSITQSTAEVVQGTTFSAEDFSVDGGIFANFLAEGAVERPAIGGSLTMTYGENNTQTLQGAIRNDSEITLMDPVLLARGVAYHLGDALEPGAVESINPGQITLATDEENPLPAPIEYANENLLAGANLARLRTISSTNNASAYDVLGFSQFSARERNDYISSLGALETQSYNRRAALLNSFMLDQFGSTARGNNVYLIGWAESWPRDIELGSAPWSTVETALYIVALDVTVEEPPSSERVQLTPDQFTWVALDRQGVDGTSGPNDLLLIPNSSMSLRYTPLSTAVLSEVDELDIRIDRSASRGISVTLDIWNWQTDQWEEMTNFREQSYIITEPEPYLGPQNMVQLRVSLGEELGSARIQELAVTQSGSF